MGRADSGDAGREGVCGNAGHGTGRDDAADGAAEARAARRLRALTDLAKALSGVHRLDDVLVTAAEHALSALDAASVSISRWERERGRLRVLVNVGTLAPGEERFPGDESYAVSDFPEILRSDEDTRAWVQTVDDPDADHERVAMLLLRGRRSCVVAPIVFEGRAWGELYASRSSRQPVYDAADRDFATALAAQVAAGLAQAQHSARIEELAYRDPMTGLGNRRAIDERLAEAIERHRAGDVPVSLIVCDVNGLKRVNDRYGHDVGDRLLAQFAGMLSASTALLPGGLAARLGGDEFCVLFEGHPADAVVDVARDLCRRAQALADGEGVACGVASTADAVGPVDSAERLFRLADAAQYRAKRSRSQQPVVAGRGQPPDLTVRLAATPNRPEVTHDRRRFRGATVGPARLLGAGLAAIDRDRSAAEGTTDTARGMAAVADTVAGLVDGCAWAVFHVPRGQGHADPVRHAQRRTPLLPPTGTPSTAAPGPQGGSAPGAEPPCAGFSPLRRTLDSWPRGAAAVRGGGYVVDAVTPSGATDDPGLSALITGHGFSGVLAAGGTGPDGGWLVEVYTDLLSLPVRGLAPALRALVAAVLASV